MVIFSGYEFCLCPLSSVFNHSAVNMAPRITFFSSLWLLAVVSSAQSMHVLLLLAEVLWWRDLQSHLLPPVSMWWSEACSLWSTWLLEPPCFDFECTAGCTLIPWVMIKICYTQISFTMNSYRIELQPLASRDCALLAVRLVLSFQQ